MNNFSYTRATDVAGAAAAIVKDEKFIAGGTNLLDLMKENVMKPSRLVDLNHLPLDKIEASSEGGLLLGALVTNADTAWNAQVEQRYPLLSRAILAGASPQLRNMATDGGNLLQRTRCYYFYDPATPCNKRAPGSGCSAIRGYNRINAIVGASLNCIAVHPSDMCVALAALDATIHVTGTNGDRKIAFEDFHRLPDDTPETDTNLRPDEVVTAIELPAKGFPEHFAYLKIRDRASYAFALVSVAVGLEMDGNIIKEARIAMGGVAHKPWRSTAVEAMLARKEANSVNFRRAAEALLFGAKGYGHNDFKIELGKRAIVRALQMAVDKEDNSDRSFS